eukprot:2128895-Prymnesium_polylepis.1
MLLKPPHARCGHRSRAASADIVPHVRAAGERRGDRRSTHHRSTDLFWLQSGARAAAASAADEG